MEKEYDIYENLASVIFDLPVAEIDKERRNTAKELVWGWAYGMRIPKEEIQNRYEASVKKMEELRKQPAKPNKPVKKEDLWFEEFED